ncbi:hypothetical protein G5C51_29200 [Streptomyces sp. A7024]|uniref:Uncharacterized protein n=1 Tax=Streptomyces coryli TaxID=1128680 RepID=A0A6G4U780_9ACTN|nr:hypothetical protein [Streptomyces coryli]NGN67963.1 hypothetical protein [Streptomyces coryli]
MSYPDPNNPYGQPPQQPQQPGGYAQPSYGYPGPPAAGAPYGGPPMGPSTMPGTVRANQVFLFVIALVQTIWCVIAVTVLIPDIEDEVKNAGTGAASEDLDLISDIGTGVMYTLVGVTAICVLLGIVLALQHGKGGNAVRICTIVYGAFGIMGGLITAALGLITTVLSILLIIFAAQGKSAAWFKRPKV